MILGRVWQANAEFHLCDFSAAKESFPGLGVCCCASEGVEFDEVGTLEMVFVFEDNGSGIFHGNNVRDNDSFGFA